MDMVNAKAADASAKGQIKVWEDTLCELLNQMLPTEVRKCKISVNQEGDVENAQNELENA